jgi:hypothetical protein
LTNNSFFLPNIDFTAIILWKRWQQYSIRKNRWNALRLGHVLCLFICDVIYTILLGTSLLSRIMSQYIKKSENSEVNKIVIEDFVQPFMYEFYLILIILLVVFLRSSKLTIFLAFFFINYIQRNYIIFNIRQKGFSDSSVTLFLL